MEPLSWTLIAQLIVKVGLPAAERIWQNAQNNAPVTAAEWQALRELNEASFDSLMPKTFPAPPGSTSTGGPP